MCKTAVRAKDKNLDHIEPVQPLETTSQSLDDFAKRLFCPADNFQVLCEPCHASKTLIEGEMRKNHRDAKKEIKKIAKKKKVI